MVKQLQFKLMLLLCALVVGSGSAWADFDELFTISSSDVVNNSSYKAYSATVSNRSFVITFGGNNKSVGTNSGNRSSCNLSSYSKYAVAPVTTSSVASAFACTTSVSDVTKISYSFNGGSNQTSTKVYLLYSSDNTTFSQLTLTSGTQGSTISSGTEYEFDTKTGYFALLFEATNSSGNWRIDDVEITFYKTAVPETQCATPTFSVAGGSYDEIQNVTINCATAGATIYYTTDGTTPTTSSSVYSNAIIVNTNQTIKAIAVKDGLTNSEEAVAVYNIDLTPILTAGTTAINCNFKAKEDYIVMTYKHIDMSTLAVVFYESGTATTTTTCDWITTSFTNSNNLKYNVAINTGEARTAYLKVSGKDENSENIVYSDLITISQTEFEFEDSWDLSTNSYSAASTTQVTWSGTYATMVVDKASSTTNANNYLPTTYNSSRFYKNSKLTISPASGYAVTSIEFEATTTGYASALANSTWTNATATVSSSTVTVTPINADAPIVATIGGTCGFTTVTYHYNTQFTKTVESCGWATYIPRNAVSFAEGDAWIVIAADVTAGTVTLENKTNVPANTPVLLKGAGPKTITISDVVPTAPETNLLTVCNGSAPTNGYYWALVDNNGTAQFMQWNGSDYSALNGFVVMDLDKSADDAPSASRALRFIFDEATGIANIEHSTLNTEHSVYNLNGQRVSLPTKGLYIKDGKKVFKK